MKPAEEIAREIAHRYIGTPDDVRPLLAKDIALAITSDRSDLLTVLRKSRLDLIALDRHGRATETVAAIEQAIAKAEGRS